MKQIYIWLTLWGKKVIYEEKNPFGPPYDWPSGTPMSGAELGNRFKWPIWLKGLWSEKYKTLNIHTDNFAIEVKVT